MCVFDIIVSLDASVDALLCKHANVMLRVLQGAGCRWWGVAWWCAATPPPARAAAPPAATTTSPCSCRPRCAPPNLPATVHHRTLPLPAPPSPRDPPIPAPPAPRVIHIDRASGTLGKGRFGKYPTVAPAAEVVIS